MKTLLTVARYEPHLESEWNNLVLSAKNTPFFFQRKFMEYHSNRFEDFSLVAFHNSKVIGAMPANISHADSTITSHDGLTFGGCFVAPGTKTPKYLEIFRAMLAFIRKSGAKRFIYKAPPLFYHQHPAAEDQYAVYINGGHLIRRDVGTISKPSAEVRFSNLRNRMIKKSLTEGITVRESDNLADYWKLLSEVLYDQHGVKPTHTLDEIAYLKRSFPENIKLFEACKEGKITAGVLIFESKSVAHAQYIAANTLGRETGALDNLFGYLLKDYYKNKDWISFGISTEKSGKFLNEGLITYKEGFGGGACVFDFYEFDLSTDLPQSRTTSVNRRLCCTNRA